MMARLLTDGASPSAPTSVTNSSSPTTPYSGGAGTMCETNKPQHVPARKLSFKTRQANSRANYRAAKVSLSSTNVALLASKFNTIVIEDGAQGRALLRKLSSSQRKPSMTKEAKRPVKTRGEGMVKAAIEIFEHQDLISESSKISKPTLKKGNDTRTKLVVVRKTSSKPSGKQDDLQKSTELNKTDFSTKDTKDINDSSNAETQKLDTKKAYVSEVKRKPSLKAKPVLRHDAKRSQDTTSRQDTTSTQDTTNRQDGTNRQSVGSRQGSANSLNQRIAEYNKNSNTNSAEKTKITQDERKPNFDMNERIAQFSKMEHSNDINHIDDKRKIVKINKSLEENKKTVTFDSEEKENKHEVTKSILRNGKNKQLSLVEQTKSRLATIVQQHNNTNQQIRPNPIMKKEKKESMSKGKFIVGEKELKVFHSVPDIIRSVELRDEEINSRLSVPKDATILENVFINIKPISTTVETSNNVQKKNNNVTGPSSLTYQKTVSTDSDQPEEKKKEEVKTASSSATADKTSNHKDSSGSLKPSIKPIASESPKLEKKNLCIASDPCERIQLDKIKPNQSFLWKPSSKMSVVTEVPIYDDRPESQNHEGPPENDNSKTCKLESKSEESRFKENDSKNSNSLDFDVASSFILEMTEQIERRFSSSSTQEKDLEGVDTRTSFDEMNESVFKNSSFLHGKPLYNSVLPEVLNKNVNISQPSNSKPDTMKTLSASSLLCKKSTDLEEIPPQLPEKRSKTTKELSDNPNLDPPPIPPSYTKPKVTRTPSEEAWIENCKKILEIPPPLRRRNGEGAGAELPSEIVQSRTTPVLEQYRSVSEKRFSVSQVELMRRMSEMNLTNKRNSLPSDTFTISKSYIEPEEDHYTSIQNDEEKDVDDQDTYEAIGENNYAEIEDGDVVGDGREVRIDAGGEEDTVSNIYDDVGEVEVEAEDHYEAINCGLVTAQDSDSSCDQSNSLYGLTRPASQGGGYQAGLAGGSDTSDEWIDLDNSDDQHESVFIFREKERRGAETWSMKVRRQWNRQTADGDIRISSPSILYVGNTGTDESCVSNIEPSTPNRTKGLVSVKTSVRLCDTYEAQEVIAFLGNEDGSDDSIPRSYENIEASDETVYCDDFDDSFSDSSFDQETNSPHVQVVEEKRQAPLSEGIYGLMKQAGQRMRKHWPLGKSLTRMHKNKSSSSIQNPANLGRRGWSFKSRDKPSTAQSTFYLHSNTLTRTDSKSDTAKVDPRRLSTASMLARPTSPPPPPPPPRNSVDESGKRKSVLNSSNSSSGDNEGYIEGQRRLSRNGNSMWYIETSTDTASEHGSSQGSDLNLRFADEPLYQFYAESIAKMTLSELSERDSEGYEEITPSDASSVPSALDLVSSCHHRSLWCEVLQVRNSGVLDTLSQSKKRLQEAKFEVMTSEASYFKSLTVLDKLFASCPLFCDDNILAREDRKTLFGNVNLVRKCSERLLSSLQSCWQDCILLQGISDVVYDHVKTERQVYIKYCTNQISMDRTLKRLKQKNSNFSTVLSQLESEPECQSLTLYSFLMLPMQRITRLRLLFDTILSLLEPSDSEFGAAQRTLDTLNKCVAECNEGARSQERHEEMVKLSRQLDFPSEMSVPILEPGGDRWLVRSGQVLHINLDAKQTFGRRLSRSGPKLMLFLFTDLLLIAKKKSEESYQVVDHCQRSLVETREIRDFPGHNRFLLQLTLLENAENKTVEMTLSCESEPDHQRWLQVLSPPQSDQPGETLYEGWDCPQVTVIHAYQPQQPDELALALGDIVNVLRKTEGWFFGERTRDGEKGWFPGNYSREIASKHVRARNLKQRHRLLQLSADFVQQQRKVKS